MLCAFLPSNGSINNESVCYNTQSMHEMYVDFQSYVDIDRVR